MPPSDILIFKNSSSSSVTGWRAFWWSSSIGPTQLIWACTSPHLDNRFTLAVLHRILDSIIPVCLGPTWVTGFAPGYIARYLVNRRRDGEATGPSPSRTISTSCIRSRGWFGPGYTGIETGTGLISVDTEMDSDSNCHWDWIWLGEGQRASVRLSETWHRW